MESTLIHVWLEHEVRTLFFSLESWTTINQGPALKKVFLDLGIVGSYTATNCSSSHVRADTRSDDFINQMVKLLKHQLLINDIKI